MYKKYIANNNGRNDTFIAPSQRLNTAKSQMMGGGGPTDAWGRETFNEFDDLEDNKSKVSGGQAASLLEKKRALFGLSGGQT